MGEDSPSTSKVDRLIPKSVSRSLSRRKRKQKQQDEVVAGADIEAGTGTGGRAGGNDDTSLATSSRYRTSQRTSSSLGGDDDDDRSLDSYESDLSRELSNTTSASPSRPPALSPHPSQIGYLTISSPEVQATHVDSFTQLPSLSTHPTSLSRSGIETATPRITISQGDTAADEETTVLARSALESPATARVVSPNGVAPRRTSRIRTNLNQTPSEKDESAPSIVNTPPTPTDSSLSLAAPSITPDRHSFSSPRDSPTPPRGTNGSGTFAWNMSSHRRSRSGPANTLGPSKLSNITTAPLTPPVETSDTASNSFTTPSGGSGFFGSVLSAAQSAATSLSNLQQTAGIGGFTGSKTRPSSSKVSTPSSQTPGPVEVEPAAGARQEPGIEREESAIRTIGTGDLNMSHLGLSDAASAIVPAPDAKFPDLADSRARSESAPIVEAPIPPSDSRSDGTTSRPRSLNDDASGNRTPPAMDLVEKSVIQRTPSLRSAIKPHRKRGSSVTTAATGNTVGAVIAAANSSLANPKDTAPKLTGFAIASKKRNRDFHHFFKSVPDDDYLIEDYSCALQREILAHGRLYVSEGHLCFSSNILGWTTTLVMSFDEIVSVEKRSTALVFKNGLMISTLHAKHIFASFTSRDATYDLIVNIWKLGHPTLRSTQNGVRVDGTGGDKTEKIDADPENDDPLGSESEDETSDEDDDEFYDEDEHADGPETQATDVSGLDGEMEKQTRKASAMISSGIMNIDAAKDAGPGSGAGSAADFPGPAAHAPTDCGDSATHYDKVIGDDVIPAPLGKVYDLVFGAGSPSWMSKWITGDQKCFDLQMEDKKGLSLDNKTRTFTYIKPLNASIGPKQTKCIVSETLDALDYEKAVNLSVSTQNPDVPSGNVFAVKTKYCLTWAENNSTRMQVNCTTEWSGKSWLKGPIEKGVNDGQTQYIKDLFAALKTAVSSRPRAGTGSNGATKGKKKGKRAKAAQSHAEIDTGTAKAKEAVHNSWGILEPVRPVLEPVADIVKSLFPGNLLYGMIIAVLLGLQISRWFGFSSQASSPYPLSYDLNRFTPDRIAAYEEMWRREDTALREWLEERVGLERLSMDKVSPRKQAMQPRTVEEKLREEKMGERDVEEAIRVTEEKLRVLKDVVERKGARPSTEEKGGDL